QHNRYSKRRHLLARLDVSGVVFRCEDGWYVQVFELFEWNGQELVAVVVLEFGEQVLRLAPGIHQSGQLTGLHLFECDRVVDGDRHDLDAEALEQDRRANGRSGTGRVEAHLLPRQVVERIDLRTGQDVDVAEVHPRDVVDALL